MLLAQTWCSPSFFHHQRFRTIPCRPQVSSAPANHSHRSPSNRRLRFPRFFHRTRCHDTTLDGVQHFAPSRPSVCSNTHPREGGWVATGETTDGGNRYTIISWSSSRPQRCQPRVSRLFYLDIHHYASVLRAAPSRNAPPFESPERERSDRSIDGCRVPSVRYIRR